MTIAVQIEREHLGIWRQIFADRLPTARLVPFESVAPGDAVDAAVLWNPPSGFLGTLRGLRFVLSRGAGVDHLLAPDVVPASAQLLRMRQAGGAARMGEFVTLSVLALHRGWLDLWPRQTSRNWRGDVPSLAAANRRVGILGLGEMGMASAERLAPFGFPLTGWSRTRRNPAGDWMRTLSGSDGFAEIVATSDILVCVLPLTPQTEGLLDAGLFAQMPQGAMLVNAGRGGHVAEADLFAAIDGGRLGGAVIDVTREEPTPPDHPFWAHPKIFLTQHGAAVITSDEEAMSAARILGCALAGETVSETIDRAQGY